MLSELMSAAFEVLLLHPGCDYKKWRSILVEQYSTELIDAFAPHLDPEDVLDGIVRLWSTPYHDRFSSLTYPFSTWAECFSTEASVQLYYDLSSLLNSSNSSVSRQ